MQDGLRLLRLYGKRLGRNLSAGEILDQYLLLSRDQGERIGSVVLMGMGEPLDNYDNVVRFLENIAHPAGAGLSHRHITLSTCGLADRIRDLARLRLQITLAVSLHAPNDALRRTLMPVARRWSLDELMDACVCYERATGRRISFEYSVIRGVNDAPACAKGAGGAAAPDEELPYQSDRRQPRPGQGFCPARRRRRPRLCGYTAKTRLYCDSPPLCRRDISGSCGQLRLGREKKGE